MNEHRPSRRERRAQRRLDNKLREARFNAPYLRDAQARGKGTTHEVQETILKPMNPNKAVKMARWRQMAHGRKHDGH